MKTQIRPRLFRELEAWRRWLAANYDKASEAWMACCKKGTGKKSGTYDEALDEALCYGWIDSTVETTHCSS